MDHETLIQLSVPVNAGRNERKYLEAAQALASREKIPVTLALKRIITEKPTLFSEYLIERGILGREVATQLSEGGR